MVFSRNTLPLWVAWHATFTGGALHVPASLLRTGAGVFSARTSAAAFAFAFAFAGCLAFAVAFASGFNLDCLALVASALDFSLSGLGLGLGCLAFAVASALDFSLSGLGFDCLALVLACACACACAYAFACTCLGLAFAVHECFSEIIMILEPNQNIVGGHASVELFRSEFVRVKPGQCASDSGGAVKGAHNHSCTRRRVILGIVREVSRNL